MCHMNFILIFEPEKNLKCRLDNKESQLSGRPDFGHKKSQSKCSKCVKMDLVCGSCSASSPGSAAPPAPSTHLPTSGGRKAPAWTAPWEAPHAYRATKSHLHTPEQLHVPEFPGIKKSGCP